MTFRSLLTATALLGALSIHPGLTQTTTTTPGAASHAWIDQPNAEWRASKLIGLAVYNRHNERLGKIEDLLLDDKGAVQAAVLGVGGFLGMGDHLVAVPFDRLTVLYRNQDGKLITSDGQLFTPDTSPVASTPAPSATTNSADPNSVNGAMNDAGHAVAGAGRAVGHAAAVAGSEAASSIRRVWSNLRGGGPDRALFDATKEELKAAPEFKYQVKT